MADEKDVSLAQVKIAGRTYPIKHSRSCKVCTSSYRMDIERALVSGSTYKTIVKTFSNEESPIEVADLRRHLRNQHVPLHELQQRALIERRAEQLGRSIEEGQEMLVDYVGVNEMLIQQGFKALQEGTIEMKASDLINALKLQHEMERSSQQGSLSDEAWAEAMYEYLKIAQRILPQELWDQFGAELQSSPVLQAIAKQMNQRREVER